MSKANNATTWALACRLFGNEEPTLESALSDPERGHVVLSRERERYANGISQAEATDLLECDVQVAERAVLRLTTVSLTDGQFGALVSFTFNLGAGALQRSTLRSKVNRGEYGDIPSELAKWVWAAGRKLPGLVQRRHAEGLLYRSVNPIAMFQSAIDTHAGEENG